MTEEGHRVPDDNRILLRMHPSTGELHAECVVALLCVQAAEWEEPESDLDDDNMFDLEGSDDVGEIKQSWAGVLLKTSLGGFLHGLTGTKVRCFRVTDRFRVANAGQQAWEASSTD